MNLAQFSVVRVLAVATVSVVLWQYSTSPQVADTWRVYLWTLVFIPSSFCFWPIAFIIAPFIPDGIRMGVYIAGLLGVLQGVQLELILGLLRGWCSRRDSIPQVPGNGA